MIIIHENQISHEPIIDLCANNHLSNDLKDAIKDFIIENKQKSMIDGRPIYIFYVSGLAELHHRKFIDYLKKLFHKRLPDKFVLRKGTFAKYPIAHYWIQSGPLIIDLAIKQFVDKNINLNPELQSLLDHSCFICDNENNPFYQLYS